MVLNAKQLSYRTVEISPGIGQVDVFKVSGQRQVPVLKDGETILSDSSAIIKYLETITKDPQLLPSHTEELAMSHLIEDWADTRLAKSVRRELIKAAALDSSLRVALLPEDFPKPFKEFVNKLPCELISGVAEVINQDESKELLNNLEQLSNLVSSNKWLIGDSLSIADIAVGAQLSLLRFPVSSGEQLHGKGCPGFNDNPKLETLFEWRDQLEDMLMATDPATL
ncbi:Glutathione S-transferase protein [Prochlorococcus sp. MIT 0602]|nr:Glutathione S-transferase protein [Prochlorococcus sp. MIT 0602]KGG18199.1 Glutathione S-transferase protein [Prochlorococcus sp. MIT 0603]